MYEAIAIAHASDRPRHADIRATLESRRLTSLAFNASQHAASLAGAVIAVWDEYMQAGARPASQRPPFMYAYGKEAEERFARVLGSTGAAQRVNLLSIGEGLNGAGTYHFITHELIYKSVH